MDDSLVRLRPKSTLLPDFDKARHAAGPPPEDGVAASPAEDEPSWLPHAGSPYVAFSRASNKPLPTLRFILGGTVRGLPYANLDSVDLTVEDKPGASPAIVLRFSGIVPREVRISGRHLDRLYDLISGHRVSWLRVLPQERDFLKGEGATVITGITVERISEFPE